MAELPSIWRVELWHPVAVHFPIALLLVGTILRLLGIGWVSTWSFHFPLMAGRTLLVLGTVGAWIAIYTGTEAYYEVVRALCDPTVADSHNYFAYWTAGLFSAGVLMDVLYWIRQPHDTAKHLMAGFACLFYIIGSSTLIYTSHLGANLVYQQGAGVYEPSPQCTEFEP